MLPRRVGTPRMSISSISKSCPAAVNWALASAMVMAGVSLPVGSVCVMGAPRFRDAVMVPGRCSAIRAEVEEGVAVVGQLADALPDVGEGAVPALLVRRRLDDVGPPPPAELLDRRHVDRAVVQEILQVRELVARKRRSVPMEFPASGTVPGSGMCVLKNSSVCAPASAQGQCRRLDRGQQTRAGVHGADVLVHRGQLGGCGADHEVRSLLHEGRSSSVTSEAISRMVWRAGSSPVISRSIQASTGGMLPAGRGTRGAAAKDGAGRRVLSGDAARPTAPARRRAPGAGLRPRGRRRRRPHRPRRRGLGAAGRPGARAHGGGGRHPAGARRPRLAAQRPGVAPWCHLPEHAGTDRLGVPGRAPGGAGEPRSANTTTRSRGGTGSPSWSWCGSRRSPSTWCRWTDWARRSAGRGGFGHTGT